MSEYNSLNAYNDKMRVERYVRSKGFGFERKVRMYEVTLDLLTTLTTSQSTVLELGCGTGLFTEKMLFAKHFQEIYATDGSDAMLSKAKQTLGARGDPLRFFHLDFTTDWLRHLLLWLLGKRRLAASIAEIAGLAVIFIGRSLFLRTFAQSDSHQRDWSSIKNCFSLASENPIFIKSTSTIRDHQRIAYDRTMWRSYTVV